MAFLEPVYDPDVFVSYSHAYTEGDEESLIKSWTISLVNEIIRECRSFEPDFKRIAIWYDGQLDRNKPLTNELQTKVKKSGIFMVVMSPFYLESEWCKDELEWFRKQTKNLSRQQGRVFVIKAKPTPDKQWPEFLLDQRGHPLPGYSFFDPKNGRPYNWRNSGITKEFTEQLWDLCTALTKTLRELRDLSKLTGTSGSDLQTKVDPRKIFIHAPGADYEVRGSVEGVLKENDLVPVTIADLGAGETRADMVKICGAMVLIGDCRIKKFRDNITALGVIERKSVLERRGKSLPCAVMDTGGKDLPEDLKAHRIKYFDCSNENWFDHFQDWLNSQILPKVNI